jgi:hypothetical protein
VLYSQVTNSIGKLGIVLLSGILYVMYSFSTLFGSVVAVTFQNIFRIEIYQNNIFFILKNLLLRSAHQNDPKHIKKLFFSKKN